MNKKEIKQINEDMRWWLQITERIDSWKLLGFTFLDSATFLTDGEQTLVLTGTQAQRLIEYFEYSEDQWDGG
jgi:hypothetical protein